MRHGVNVTPLQVGVKFKLSIRRKLQSKKRSKRLWDHVDLFKTPSRPTVVIRSEEIAAYLRIFDDEMLKNLLWKDSCCILADKYLLAMVFVYFKKCYFTIEEYTKENFFVALFLANTMEEEDEFSRYDILFWALLPDWRKKVSSFVKQRDRMWARMNYRAAVNRRCCEKIMALVPSNVLWKRERAEHHGGAERIYEDKCYSSFGPNATPVNCALCSLSRFAEKFQSATAPADMTPLDWNPEE